MSTPVTTTREEVMFFDTDIGGVVHNLAYLRMIETCRTRLAGTLGMDLKEMARTQLYPVVTRTEIDYKRPGTLSATGWKSPVASVRFGAPASGANSKSVGKATGCCS